MIIIQKSINHCWQLLLQYQIGIVLMQEEKMRETQQMSRVLIDHHHYTLICICNWLLCLSFVLTQAHSTHIWGILMDTLWSVRKKIVNWVARGLLWVFDYHQCARKNSFRTIDFHPHITLKYMRCNMRNDDAYFLHVPPLITSILLH
jgi:hypothetical protein